MMIFTNIVIKKYIYANNKQDNHRCVFSADLISSVIALSSLVFSHTLETDRPLPEELRLDWLIHD